jgi:30S ribosomal protein S31
LLALSISEFFVKPKNINAMGKGDKKTKRGKIVNRSYGVRRRKNNKAPAKAAVLKPTPVVEEKVKEIKQVKPKIAKEAAVPKEVKVPKEPKEIETIKEPKETKSVKAPKESKEPKEPKTTKAPKKKTE